MLSRLPSYDLMMRTLCPEKKTPKCFFVISLINLGRFWRNLVHSFLTKFAAKYLNVFHVTWIMSLHYLVKLEMLITHVLPLRCQIKKLQNLSHLNCGLQIRHIWIQLITKCVGNIATEGVQNPHHWFGAIDDATDEWLPQWRHLQTLSKNIFIQADYAFSALEAIDFSFNGLPYTSVFSNSNSN